MESKIYLSDGRLVDIYDVCFEMDDICEKPKLLSGLVNTGWIPSELFCGYYRKPIPAQ